MDGNAAAGTTARQSLVFLNGDIEGIRTGGTLLDRDIIEQLRMAGFAVRVVHPALLMRNKHYWKPTVIGLLANFFETFRTFEKGDVVLVSHGVYRDIWLARWVWLLRFQVRIVHFAYHFDFNLKTGVSRFVRRFIESFALRRSRLVFAISESGRAQAVELGVSPERVKVIPVMQTRPPLFELPRREGRSRCVFLFVGTIEPRKGLHVAFEALKQVPAEMRCELRIAGIRGTTGPYHEDLVRTAGSLEGCVVQFLGRISDTDLEAEYANADVFLFPSLWEGYGIAIEEALCHGLPVIATTAGSIPELVRDGQEGWLVPPEEAAPLAKAILHCLAQPEERHRRAGNALQRAKELSQRRGTGAVVRDTVIDLLNERP